MKTLCYPTCRILRNAARSTFGPGLMVALLAGWTASAATRYVWQGSPSPAAPYTEWITAAHVIQDAVDAAADGDTVLVAGGVYSTGGRAMFGTMTNRVAIDKAITVESLMGPEVTVIEGAPAPGSSDGNGDGAIRCIYLGTNAVLSGFTLTNGHTRTAGDSTQEQSGGGAWCEPSALLTNCVLIGNSANRNGGGAAGGTLRNCTLDNNSAYGNGGGGAFQSTLHNCRLTGNVAGSSGGGAWGSTLYNCTLTGNSASTGGGCQESTLYNCTLTENSASSYGGGSYSGWLYNCTLTGNSAQTGGGIAGGSLFNCIVYFNTASSGPNYAGILIWSWPPWGSVLMDPWFNHSCTTPLPSEGTNNIAADPQMATLTHLSATSPCIGAGSGDDATGVDIDGEPWADPPCMGADQLTPGQATGPLTMFIEAEYTSVAPGFAVRFSADNQGAILASVWDLDDGTVVTNQPVVSHAWSAPGNYTVRLTGYNDSFPNGVSATLYVEVTDQAHYVNQANPTPVFPYTSWETAATNLQDAIETRTAGGLVLVTNGVYASGSVEVEGTNRIALTYPVQVRSVNGPEVTIIQGGVGVRCAYLDTNTILSGFTLTHGTMAGNYPYGNGGGAWCEGSAVLTNCIVAGNAASSDGGGVFGGTLYNCRLTENSASYGGGASGGTLRKCMLTGNSASDGGGVSDGTLYNCTLTGNSASSYGGGASGGTLHNCSLTGNSANWGGGSRSSTLFNCTLTGNSAGIGGGSYGGGMHNCTLTDNSADLGGGSYGSTLYNSIVYFNTAPTGPNYSGGNFNYSCTTPLPTNGIGNISADPQLITLTHLSSSSPCIAAGSSVYASGVDIDGEAWVDPPCMGADQFIPGQATGPLTLAIRADYTNAATEFAVHFVAQIQGSIASSIWDFDDGTFATDQAFVSHAWSAPGSYAVRLTGYNADHPAGVVASVHVGVVEGVCYVSQANPAPAFPYASWDTAATNIQDAIETRTAGSLVLVTNGVYASGSIEAEGTNRIALTYPVQVRSVNGPEVTAIEGAEGVRCAYVGNRASLSGFTLTKGSATTGGGAWCEHSATLTNCIVTGNLANSSGGGTAGGILYNCTLTGNSAGYGGGASEGTLHNCIVRMNSARWNGGGTSGSTLYSCIIVGNSAYDGGGVEHGALYHCTLADNSANDGGGAYFSELHNCTLTGNSAKYYGGGANFGALYNCILTGNSALDAGGGAFWSSLYHCTVTGNSATYDGGGSYGGRLNDCILTNNSARDGGGALFGTLYNCTLTGNSATHYGGGSWRGTLSNCTLTANSASLLGGGSSGSTLYNCALTGNSAVWGGGGVSDSTLYNCTLTGNSATGPSAAGGGSDSGTLYNCIVCFNTASTGPNYDSSTFQYSCTTPLPTNAMSVGNITNTPLFVNTNGWSDLHLRYSSPGIDAGTNLSDILTTDFDGNSRPLDGDGDGDAAFDMGAYEFDARSMIPQDWFTSHGLDPADPQVVSGNPDQDAFTTFQEWVADTDPTNGQSYFRIEAISRSSPITVYFQSSSDRLYSLLSATNLLETAWTVLPGQTAVPGTGGWGALSDTNAAPAKFYKVGVSVPGF